MTPMTSYFGGRYIFKADEVLKKVDKDMINFEI